MVLQSRLVSVSFVPLLALFTYSVCYKPNVWTESVAGDDYRSHEWLKALLVGFYSNASAYIRSPDGGGVWWWKLERPTAGGP